MKYWLLTTEYPPFFGGGISTYCYHTAQMLGNNGHTVSVFINDAAISNIKIEEQGNNIRTIRFNPSQTNSSAFLGHVTNISYEFAHVVKQFIEKEGRPDIIEAQEYLGIAYYLLQYKHLLYEWCKDVPVLITMHSPSFLYMEYNHVPMYRYPNYWICEMERFCLQAADHIISPSNYMISELGNRFELANKNITVVPNPFSIKELTGSTDENNIANEIVFYGKLTAQKGAFKLLTYFSELWDNGFSRPLHLLGGQDIVYHPEGVAMGDLLRKKYKRYIQNGFLKLENKIAPSEIANRLSRAEVVIIPSNNDNLPYVVFEMMALGKVVLVSKQGGQSEVVTNNFDGFIFDHKQPVTFSEQLKRILELDNQEKRNISNRAAQKIKDQYSAETIYKQKIKVIQEIIRRENISEKKFPFVRSADPVKSTAENGTHIKGKLTIVVPYFNMGKYINETIESLLNSDFADKEIIIVNDGSTDKDSIFKLNHYRHNPSIKIIDSKNEGLAKARNLGALHSSGEWLAFLDADDTIQTGYYSRAISVLKKYENIHFVGCWTQYFENSKKVWPAFMPEPPLILFHNLVNSSALVYKKNSFLAAGKNDTSMIFPGLEDYETVISLTSNGLKGVVLPEILFNYRVRSDSMIRGISKEKKLLLYQNISIKHKQFYAAFAAETFNLVNANGAGLLLDNPSLDHHLADKLPFGGKAALKMIRLIKRNRHIKHLTYKIYRLLNK